MKKLGAKVKELWRNNLLVTNSDITAILAGSYISNGTDGEGETNGVPTDSDAILDGTYSHKDFDLDGYAPDSNVTDEDLTAILADTYSDDDTDSGAIISDDIINAILDGTYTSDDDEVTDDDIAAILDGWY